MLVKSELKAAFRKKDGHHLVKGPISLNVKPTSLRNAKGIPRAQNSAVDTSSKASQSDHLVM